MGPRILPFAIEPHHRWIVSSNDFFELSAHVFVVTLVIGVLRVSLIEFFMRVEVGMVPIHDRVVGAELDALPLALVAQLL